jgi:hypothetical protein
VVCGSVIDRLLLFLLGLLIPRKLEVAVTSFQFHRAGELPACVSNWKLPSSEFMFLEFLANKVPRLNKILVRPLYYRLMNTEYSFDYKRLRILSTVPDCMHDNHFRTCFVEKDEILYLAFADQTTLRLTIQKFLYQVRLG